MTREEQVKAVGLKAGAGIKVEDLPVSVREVLRGVAPMTLYGEGQALARMEWVPARGGSKELVIQHMNRLQDTLHVMVADAQTGLVKTLFTEADARATGPTAWGTWKAELVGALVARVAARLRGEPPPSAAPSSWSEAVSAARQAGPAPTGSR